LKLILISSTGAAFLCFKNQSQYQTGISEETTADTGGGVL